MITLSTRAFVLRTLQRPASGTSGRKRWMPGDEIDEIAHVGNVSHVLERGSAPCASIAPAGERYRAQRPGLDVRLHRPAREYGDAEAGFDQLDDGFRQLNLLELGRLDAGRDEQFLVDR